MTVKGNRDKGRSDWARFARPSALPGVELVSVAYRDRAFPIHTHAEYVIGVVTEGAEVLETGGARHIVAAGDVLQLHPGQPHANRSHGPDTLRYDVFYLPAEILLAFHDHVPAFASPVIPGHRHAHRLSDCHAVLSDTASGALEQETALMAVVRTITNTTDAARPVAQSGPAIDRARAYIDAHFADNFGLSTLSAVADLSVFHLARSFKAAVGLSPLAYRNQRRVTEARRRLLAGERIADIALDLGFADQSHLTRQFQKLVGVSPGAYGQQ